VCVYIYNAYLLLLLKGLVRLSRVLVDLHAGDDEQQDGHRDEGGDEQLELDVGLGWRDANLQANNTIMDIELYIYIYIYIYIYLHGWARRKIYTTTIYIYIYKNLYIFMCIYVCMYIYIYINRYVYSDEQLELDVGLGGRDANPQDSQTVHKTKSTRAHT